MDVFPSEKQNYIKAVVQGSSGLSGGSLTDSLPGHREVHRVVGDGGTHSADRLQDMQAWDAMCASEHAGHPQTGPLRPRSTGLRPHHPQRGKKAVSLKQAWKADLGAGR